MRVLVARLVAVLVAGGLMMPTTVAAGLQPSEPRPRADEEAIASWVLPTSEPRTLRWLAILAFRSDDPSATSGSIAVPIRGTCRLDRDRELESCLGSGRIHDLRDGEFAMDEQLSSGRIDFVSRGKRYRATLAGSGPGPHLYLQTESCVDPNGEEGSGEGGGILREAQSDGTFAGRKLSPPVSRHELSHMARGAMVTECSRWGPTIEIMGGGRVEATWAPPRDLGP